MSDDDSNPWSWTPNQYPEMPSRVRDNEEGIRTLEDQTEYLEDDMNAIRDLVSSARKGIWTLVIQAFVVMLGGVVTWLLTQGGGG